MTTTEVIVVAAVVFVEIVGSGLTSYGVWRAFTKP
jgi:hypothetical protein